MGCTGSLLLCVRSAVKSLTLALVLMILCYLLFIHISEMWLNSGVEFPTFSLLPGPKYTRNKCPSVFLPVFPSVTTLRIKYFTYLVCLQNDWSSNEWEAYQLCPGFLDLWCYILISRHLSKLPLYRPHCFIRLIHIWYNYWYCHEHSPFNYVSIAIMQHVVFEFCLCCDYNAYRGVPTSPNTIFSLATKNILTRIYLDAWRSLAFKYILFIMQHKRYHLSNTRLLHMIKWTVGDAATHLLIYM